SSPPRWKRCPRRRAMSSSPPTTSLARTCSTPPQRYLTDLHLRSPTTSRAHVCVCVNHLILGGPKEFARFREDVIRHERLLVTNISLAVDHPYHYLVSLAKAVDRTSSPPCVCVRF